MDILDIVNRRGFKDARWLFRVSKNIELQGTLDRVIETAVDTSLEDEAFYQAIATARALLEAANVELLDSLEESHSVRHGECDHLMPDGTTHIDVGPNAEFDGQPTYVKIKEGAVCLWRQGEWQSYRALPDEMIYFVAVGSE